MTTGATISRSTPSVRSSCDVPHFTPIEKKILEKLSDGLPHKWWQVIKCLDDELATRYALSMHLARIRKKLRPLGEDIICETNGWSIFYRHVRLISNPYK